ncbi:MAG: hypothetical protein AAF346_11720 [Pseudomonadota bacterium]
MALTKILLASVAIIAVGATATLAAEVPAQQPIGTKIGQLSKPTASLPDVVRGAKAKTGVQVAQRWKRRRRRSRRRGRAVAGAIALGIAAIIAAEAARANDRGHHYGRKCRRWARLCDRGRDWACDKYDYRC